jgi:hypothetical protein
MSSSTVDQCAEEGSKNGCAMLLLLAAAAAAAASAVMNMHNPPLMTLSSARYS